jgi:uncharacterized protein
MSAAQPKSSEPSMEEILASIRKIISDDTGSKPAEPAAAAPPPAINPLPPIAAAPPAPPPAAAVVEDDDDVMDLMPMVPKPAPVAAAPYVQPSVDPFAVEPPPTASASILDEGADLAFQMPAEPPAPVAPPKQATDFEALMAQAEFSPKPAAPSAMEGLMSPATDRVVSTAFSSLASTVLTNNARTLDSLVEDMMRPMIKSWLDDNLPGIVERLIRAEIERVARGGR